MPSGLCHPLRRERDAAASGQLAYWQPGLLARIGKSRARKYSVLAEERTPLLPRERVEL